MARSTATKEIPPPLELECLRALWSLGEGSVRGVREIVTRDRDLAYTTIMTVLDRLVRRGGVERRKVGRSFVYRPLISREALQKLAVQQLVDAFFDGSEDALIRHLGRGTNGTARVSAAVAGDLVLDAALL